MRTGLAVVAALTAIVAAVLLLPPSRATAQQDSSALINEVLDQPVSLNLDTVLPKAMSKIGEQTGVKIEADPVVWELLPWGEQTNVKARIENQTLRNAVDAIAQKLGLRAVLRPQALELQPMPALRRLGRRATDVELEALSLLATTPLRDPKAAAAAAEKLTVEQLVEAADARLQQVKPEFAIELRRRDMVPLQHVVSVPRNATIGAALEALAQETNATWYPWGRSIVVLPKEAQVRANQLGRTVTLRYTDVDVSQVLLELSKASGVAFEIEAGAVQRIPPESRKVSLILDNASVLEALEALSGFTGLDYAVSGDTVRIWNQSAAVGLGAAQQDPAVGMIQLDNGIQVMIRRSHLPPDVAEYIDYRKNKAIANLREMMKEEGFQPTTQPGQPAPTSAPPASAQPPAGPAASPQPAATRGAGKPD